MGLLQQLLFHINPQFEFDLNSLKKARFLYLSLILYFAGFKGVSFEQKYSYLALNLRVETLS